MCISVLCTHGTLSKGDSFECPRPPTLDILFCQREEYKSQFGFIRLDNRTLQEVLWGTLRDIKWKENGRKNVLKLNMQFPQMICILWQSSSMRNEFVTLKILDSKNVQEDVTCTSYFERSSGV